ncbi:MAG: hypothetical protein RSA99_02080, partial [Oscillospiraceae bacterium]
MKGKIKIMSLLLATAMVSSMFVACKKDDPATNNGSSDAKNPASKVEVPKDKGKDDEKLLWYHWGESPKKPDAVIKALNEQSKKDINTEIEFRFAPDEEKLKTVISTAGEFDITFTCSWFANYVQAAQKNQFADLSQYDRIKTITPNLWASMPESYWDGAKVNGKIYGVPTYKDTAATQFWRFNKEFVYDGAKAEAEAKATQDSLKLSKLTPVLEKVKQYADKGNKYPHGLTAPISMNWAGLNGYNNGWDTVSSDDLRIGFKIDGGDTKLVSMYADADFIDNMKTLQDWNKRGLSNKGASQLEKEPEFTCVGTGQAWPSANVAVYNVKKDYHEELVKKCGPYLTTAGVQGSMQAISPGSKHINKSLKYIEYMNTNATYRTMLGRGIEGTDWKKDANGTAETLTDNWLPGLFSQASFMPLLPAAPAPVDMYTKE